MTVEFINLPVDDMTYMGITSDSVKSVVVDNIPVGVIYLSEGYEDNTIYVEYLELLTVYRGKHLLRPIFTKLSEEYGTLIFEAEDDLTKKYKAIGAIQGSYDEDREMYSWQYRNIA